MNESRSNQSLDVSVLIVNYNSADVVVQAIASAAEQIEVSHEIIVIDNSSPDDSVERLRKSDLDFEMIESPDNLGFGAGNNRAFEKANGRYIYLMNPDARLAEPDTLRTMVGYMDAHPHVGLAGTRLLNLDGSDQWRPRDRYPGQKFAEHAVGGLPGTIAWVIGASMFVRREVFEDIDGFDEDYFLYAEETDLCLRVRKAGHHVGFIENARVFHHDAYSQRTTPPYEVWVRKQDGLHIFYEKAYGKDAARRAVTRELRKAQYRLAMLTLQSKLGKANTAKEAKYRAFRDSAEKYLLAGDD